MCENQRLKRQPACIKQNKQVYLAWYTFPGPLVFHNALQWAMVKTESPVLIKSMRKNMRNPDSCRDFLASNGQ